MIGLYCKNVLMQKIRVFVNSWNDVVNNSRYQLVRKDVWILALIFPLAGEQHQQQQTSRNETTRLFFRDQNKKLSKTYITQITKCWILLSLKKHLALYFVFQILWPNKKRRTLYETFTKRQNPNGQIYSTEDSKIGVDCQNQRYIFK